MAAEAGQHTLPAAKRADIQANVALRRIWTVTSAGKYFKFDVTQPMGWTLQSSRHLAHPAVLMIVWRKQRRKIKMKTICAAVAFMVVITVAGCKVGKPGKVESTVMGEIKHNVTIGGKDWKNPVPYTEDAVKEGAEHFEHHCGICHGLDGQHTGVPFASTMSPPVAD